MSQVWTDPTFSAVRRVAPVLALVWSSRSELPLPAPDFWPLRTALPEAVIFDFFMLAARPNAPFFCCGRSACTVTLRSNVNIPLCRIDKLG